MSRDVVKAPTHGPDWVFFFLDSPPPPLLSDMPRRARGECGHRPGIVMMLPLAVSLHAGQILCRKTAPATRFMSKTCPPIRGTNSFKRMFGGNSLRAGPCPGGVHRRWGAYWLSKVSRAFSNDFDQGHLAGKFPAAPLFWIERTPARPVPRCGPTATLRRLLRIPPQGHHPLTPGRLRLRRLSGQVYTSPFNSL